MITLSKVPKYSKTGGTISGELDFPRANLFGNLTASIEFDVETFVRANDGRFITVGDANYQTADYFRDDEAGFEEFKLGDTVNVLALVNVATSTTLLAAGDYLISDKVDDYTVRLSKTNGDPLVEGVDVTRGSADSGAIRLAQEPYAFSYDFGLIGNDEGVNFLSKIDGQELRHTLDVGGALALGVPTTFTDKYKASAKVGDVTITKTAEDLSNKKWSYLIEQTFYVNPFFVLEQLAALQEDEPYAILAGSASLRHVFRVRTYRTAADSPIFEEKIYDAAEGDIGGFDELYNNQAPSFSLASLNYTNGIGQATRDDASLVQISLLQNDGAGGFVELSFILLPELESQYKNLNSPMFENYVFDKATIPVGGAPVNGQNFGGDFQVFRTCSATSSGGTTNITATIDFGALAKAAISDRDEKRYLIVANAYAAGATMTTANETCVRVDFNEIGFVVPDATVDVETTVLKHDSDTVEEGFLSVDAMTNAELVGNSLILLDHSTFDDILLEKVRGSIIATNGSETAELYFQEFDTSSAQVVAGARLVDASAPSGLNVRADELRANFKLVRESSSDTATQYAYRLLFPFMVRWEYWEQLVLDSLPAAFFDAGERFNGYNHEWNRLGDLSGFELRLRVDVDVSLKDGNLATEVSDYTLANFGYDANPSFIAKSIELLDADEVTPLSYAGEPYIKKGIFTKIVATFQKDAALDAADYWGEIEVGRFEGHTFKTIRTFSTEYDREAISYLSSKGGNGRAVLANSAADTLQLCCFIDPDEFPEDSADYEVFAQIDGRGVLNPFVGDFLTTNTEGGSSASDQLFLPINGTIDAKDNGDGNSDLANPYTYAVGGAYTVKVFSESDWYLQYNNTAANDTLKITNISRWGSAFKPTGLNGALFSQCLNLKITANDLLDTSSYQTFRDMFRNNYVLENVPRINEWDKSLITSCQQMFQMQGTSLYNQELNWTLPLCDNFVSFFKDNGSQNSAITLNLSIPASFASAFQGATALNSPVTINGQINNAQNMFTDCSVYDKATTLDIVDGANFTQTFNRCSALNSPVVVNGEIGNLNLMFRLCVAFDQPLTLNVLATGVNAQQVFEQCTVFDSPLIINGKFTNTNGMFNNAIAFNQDVSAFDMSVCTYTGGMFLNAQAFNQNLGAWDMSKNTGFLTMFQNASAFNNGGSPDIQNWIIRNDGAAVTMNSMFLNAQAFNQPLSNWERVGSSLAYVTDMKSMLRGCTVFNQNISAWDVSRVTDFEQMFQLSTAFNNGEATDTGANPLTWTIRNDGTPVDMRSMFQQTDFNQDVGSFNMLDVEEVRTMFYVCPKFNNGGSDAIRNWVFPNVTTLEGMFESATSFNQPIGDWDTSNISRFYAVLRTCYAFNQDLSGWSFQSVPAGSDSLARAFENTAIDQANANALIGKIASDFETFAITGVTIGASGVDITGGDDVSGTTSTGGTTITDAAATFVTDGVASGWYVINETTGERSTVLLVTGETTLTLTGAIMNASDDYAIYESKPEADRAYLVANGCVLGANDFKPV